MPASGATLIPQYYNAPPPGSAPASGGAYAVPQPSTAPTPPYHHVPQPSSAPPPQAPKPVDAAPASRLPGQGTMAGVGCPRAAAGPAAGKLAAANTASAAGKAADSAAAYSLHSASFRPSALQYSFTNPSMSLSLKASSQDLDSAESSGVHAPVRCFQEAATPPAQQFSPTLDSAWDDMLDRRRRGVHRRGGADHDSPAAVACRRAAGCAVDAAVVEQSGSSAEARARVADSTTAAEQVIAHLDLLTHDLAHAGVLHAARQPPPDVGSPASFAAALARLLRRSRSGGSPPPPADPPPGASREQSGLLSAILTSYTSSVGEGAGPLPEPGCSGAMPDHSSSALFAMAEPSTESMRRVTPPSSSNPFRSPPACSDSDTVSNPFLSPPPSGGYPQSSSSCSPTESTAASSIEIPLDPNGSLSHRRADTGTAAERDEGSSPQHELHGSSSGVAAARQPMSTASSVSADVHELQVCMETFNTQASDVSTAVLDVESRDLHAVAAGMLGADGAGRGRLEGQPSAPTAAAGEPESADLKPDAETPTGASGAVSKVALQHSQHAQRAQHMEHAEHLGGVGVRGGEPFLTVTSAPQPTSSSSCHSPPIPSPRPSQPPPPKEEEEEHEESACISSNIDHVREHTGCGEVVRAAMHRGPRGEAPEQQAPCPSAPIVAVAGGLGAPTPMRELTGMTAVAIPDSLHSAVNHVELSPVPSGNVDEAPMPRPQSPAKSENPPGKGTPGSAGTASPSPSARSSPPLRLPKHLSPAVRPPPLPPLLRRPPQPPLPVSCAAVVPRAPAPRPAQRAHTRPYQPANPSAPPLHHPRHHRAESSSVSISSSSSVALRALTDTATLRDNGATSSSITFQGELSLIGDSGMFGHGDSAATDSGPVAPAGVLRRHPGHSSGDSGSACDVSEDIATLSFAQQLRQTVEAVEAGGEVQSGSAALSDVTTPRLPSAPTSLFNSDSVSAALSPRPGQPRPPSPRLESPPPVGSMEASAAAANALAAAAAAAARHAVPTLPLQGPNTLGTGSPRKPTRDLNRLFQEPAAQRAAAAWNVRHPVSVGAAYGSGVAPQRPQRQLGLQSHPAGPARPRMTMREQHADMQRRAPAYRVEPPTTQTVHHAQSSQVYLRTPVDIRNPRDSYDSPRQRQPFPRQPSPLQRQGRASPLRSPRLTRSPRGAGPALRTARRADARTGGSPAGRRSGIRGRSGDPAPCYSPRPFAPDDSFSMPERRANAGGDSHSGDCDEHDSSGAVGGDGGGGGATERPRKRSRGRDRLTSGDGEFFSVAELIRGHGSSRGHYPASGPNLRPPASTGNIRPPNPYRMAAPYSAAAAAASQPALVPVFLPSYALPPLPISARQPPPTAKLYGAAAPASMPPPGVAYIPRLPRLPVRPPIDPDATPPPVPRGVPPGLNLPSSLSSQGTAHSGTAHSTRPALRPPKHPSALPPGPTTVTPPPREPSSPTSSLAHSGSVISSIPSNFLPPLMPPTCDERLAPVMAAQASLALQRDNNAFATGVLDLAQETEVTTAQAAGRPPSSASAASLKPQGLSQRQQSIDAEKSSVSSSLMFWDEESAERLPAAAAPLPQVPERSLSGDAATAAAAAVAAAAAAAPHSGTPPRTSFCAAGAPRQRSRAASVSPTRQPRSGLAPAPASTPEPIPVVPAASTPPTSGSAGEPRPAYWAVMPSERSGSRSGDVTADDMRSLLYTLPNPASGVSFARTPSSSSGSGDTPLTPMDIPASINSNAAARRLGGTGEVSTMSGISGPSGGAAAAALGTHSTSAGTLPSAPPSAERPAAAYGRVAAWSRANSTLPLSATVSAAPASLRPRIPLIAPNPVAQPLHSCAGAAAMSLDVSSVERELMAAATIAYPPWPAQSRELGRRDSTGTDTVQSSAGGQAAASSPAAGRSRAALFSPRAKAAELAEPRRSVSCLRLLFSGPQAAAPPRSAAEPRLRLSGSLQSSSGSPGFRKLLRTGQPQSQSPVSGSRSVGGRSPSSRIRVGGRDGSSSMRGPQRRPQQRPGRLAAAAPPPPQSVWRHCLCLRGRDGVYNV